MLSMRLLVAVGGRRVMVAVLVALLAAAVMVTVGGAASAQAAGSPVLAQGAGMNEKPSVRVRRVQRVLREQGLWPGCGGGGWAFWPGDRGRGPGVAGPLWVAG